jgi:Radical SAM superfamily
MKRAIVIILNNALEHHVTLVYRTVFLGEALSVIDRLDGWRSEGYDTLIDQLSLTDLLAIFATKPECVLLCADVHHSPTARFLAETAKAVSPNSEVFIFGRATSFIPQYFDRSPISAIHESGDREVAIAEYLLYLDGLLEEPAGVRLVATGRRKPGRWAAEKEWAFPKLSVLPVEGYKEYVRETYGDHYTPRISATVGKGCSWGCNYCGATTEEGARDRRRIPGAVVEWANTVDYLKDAFSLHLYHPNLFANRQWISKFCQEYSAHSSRFSWRGVTTTVTLRDPGLVELAGSSGCRELAVGVETLFWEKDKSPKSTIRVLEEAAANCGKAQINLKALVMVGYPGQNKNDLEFTKSFLIDLGMVIRFTGYTPLQKLSAMTQEQLDGISLERFDRRTYYDPEAGISRDAFFETLIKNGGYEFPDFDI